MTFVPWFPHAACRDRTDVDWFPEPNEDAAPAKAVCRTCPHQIECLTYALSPGHLGSVGVLGGTTERERRSMRRRTIAERRAS